MAVANSLGGFVALSFLSMVCCHGSGVIYGNETDGCR